VCEVEDEAAIVMSSDWFDTELEASNNATTPANLPSTIADMGLLVGRFVVQSGSYTPTIESAFSNIFIPAVVTNHEALIGLQGSTIGTGGGHYHLTSQDYTGNGTGVVVRSDGASLTNATITGSITTASHAAHATSASHALNANNADSISFIPLTATSASWVSASVTINSASYATTSSWAANVVPLVTASTYPITSSWSNNSISSSYSPVEPAYSASISTQFTTKQDTLVTGNTYEITASWANTSSWAINAVNGGTTITTGSTLPITASQAVTASYSPVEPAYSASISTLIGTKQDTLITGNTYPITASWAVSASWTPDIEPASSSWASSSISSSYSVSASWAPGASSVIFSRGGTFYDPYGLSGNSAFSQSVIIWRAPFTCTATAIWGYQVANAVSTTSSLTAWHNGATMLTAPIAVTASNVWVAHSASTLISTSFAIGDRLQITLLTCSFGTTQSAVQIDFTRP
jgi:hypothetical protein